MNKLENFNVTTLWYSFDFKDGKPRRIVYQKVLYPKNLSDDEENIIIRNYTSGTIEVIRELVGEQKLIVQGGFKTLNLVYGEKCPYCGLKLKKDYPTKWYCEYCGKQGLKCCFKDHKCDRTQKMYKEIQRCLVKKCLKCDSFYCGCEKEHVDEL